MWALGVNWWLTWARVLQGIGLETVRLCGACYPGTNLSCRWPRGISQYGLAVVRTQHTPPLLPDTLTRQKLPKVFETIRKWCENIRKTM